MRQKITAEMMKRKSARNVQTKFKTKLSPLTRKTLKLTGTGKNSRRKKTARSWLR